MERMLRRIYRMRTNAPIYSATTRRNVKRPWSRRTQSREMIHGLCSLHERHARFRHGQTRTQTRILPPAGERDVRIASAHGRARDCPLPAEQQVHRRGRARDRAALFLDPVTHATQKRRKSEMTTLPIRAPIVQSLAGLARVLSYIDIAIEVFAEA